MIQRIILLFLLHSFTGCGGGLSKVDTEQVKEIITASLNIWKAKEPVSSIPQGWLFVDEDWKATATLTEFTITNVTVDNDKLPRCWVTLKLLKRGNAITREVCYIVDLSRKIANRDPYS